jgi:hypothetical protein
MCSNSRAQTAKRAQAGRRNATHADLRPRSHRGDEHGDDSGNAIAQREAVHVLSEQERHCSKRAGTAASATWNTSLRGRVRNRSWRTRFSCAIRTQKSNRDNVIHTWQADEHGLRVARDGVQAHDGALKRRERHHLEVCKWKQSKSMIQLARRKNEQRLRTLRMRGSVHRL